MRHHSSVKKLGLERKGRTALIRTLAVSLFEHGRIQTTETRAKALRPYVERIVTKAKENTLASKRYVESVLGSGAASVMKQVTERSQASKARAGGYTRIIKMIQRKSDGAARAIIEFVD